MANVGVFDEQNLLPSCIYNKTSETRDPIPQTDLRTSPDLLPYLERFRVTRKRSRKEKIITVNEKNVVGPERIHIQGQGNVTDESYLRQSCQGNSKRFSATISNSYKNVFDNEVETLQISEMFGPAVTDETMLVLADNDLRMNPLDSSDHPKVDGIYDMDEIKLTSCRNYIAMEEDVNLPKNNDSFSCSMIKDEVGERPHQNSMKSIDDSQLCVPDTLDHTPDMTTSQALMTESNPEDEEMSAGSSNLSSEKVDSDSCAPEIANSMMTVLLPRALPLLKTFSRRKRNKLKPLEKSAHICVDENGMNNNRSLAVLSHGAKETLDLNQNKRVANSSDTSDPCVHHLESVVADSFDNDGSENYFSKNLSLIPDVVVEDVTLVDPENGQSGHISEADVGSPGCYFEAMGSKRALVLDLDPNGDVNLASTSSKDLAFPPKRDTSMDIEQNSFGPQSLEENAKTLHDYIEGIPDPASLCQEYSEIPVKKDLARDKDLPELYGSISDLQNQTVYSSTDAAQKQETEDGSTLNNSINLKHNIGMEGVLKIVACPMHPTPILMVLLSTVGNDFYLCLLCGSLAQENKVLLIYSAPITGSTAGCPSFISHSPVILPFMKDSLGRNIALENSAVQFTPNSESLVLVNSIKVPCCREGNIHCPCLSCTSDCLGDNALKIVQVKVGYVLVVTKLRTAQTVRCLLVCEPNHLLAADESGKLYLWVMNTRWSGYIEQCYLSMPDHMPSSLLELKRIPKSAVLVVGHNGFGEFGLWDIEKRILVSKFSAPSTCIYGCVPISLFPWQIKGSVHNYSSPEKLIDEVLDATKMSFSGSSGNKLALPAHGEDVAIWLLVSTISDPDLHHSYESDDSQIDTVGCWKLALLIKDFVIMGSALDLRATAIGTSSGHGIIGRSDGLVYIWELSTGIKVGSLHHFKGKRVSCIAADSSNSGALAIANEEGELLVCMHSLESSAECQH